MDEPVDHDHASLAGQRNPTGAVNMPLHSLLQELKQSSMLDPLLIMVLADVLLAACVYAILEMELLSGTDFRHQAYGSDMAALDPYAHLFVVVVVLSCLLLFELTLLRPYQRNLASRIERAGLLQRLAQGTEALPDIAAYTPWPWRLAIKKPEKDLSKQTGLLVEHLDWYLQPEPRTYFNPIWVMQAVFVTAGIGVVGWLLLGFPAVSTSASVQAQLSAVDKLLDSMTYTIKSSMLLASAGGAIRVFQITRMQITRRALAAMIMQWFE